MLNIDIKNLIIPIALCLLLINGNARADYYETGRYLVHEAESINQENYEILEARQKLNGIEWYIAESTYNDYNKTSNLLDAISVYLLLYHYINENKRDTPRDVINLSIKSYIKHLSLIQEDLLINQTQTKLPYLNNKAESLKQRINNYKKVLGDIKL